MCPPADNRGCTCQRRNFWQRFWEWWDRPEAPYDVGHGEECVCEDCQNLRWTYRQL